MSTDELCRDGLVVALTCNSRGQPPECCSCCECPLDGGGGTQKKLSEKRKDWVWYERYYDEKEEQAMDCWFWHEFDEKAALDTLAQRTMDEIAMYECCKERNDELGRADCIGYGMRVASKATGNSGYVVATKGRNGREIQISIRWDNHPVDCDQGWRSVTELVLDLY